MDHRCPHRCASLFLGRNEEGGIRCVYHGWKYRCRRAIASICRTPRRNRTTRTKVRAKAYKVAERNGLVWVYMGERGPRRLCRGSRRRYCRQTNCRSLSRSASAIGCRRSKATSTPRISAFCMPARSIRQNVPADNLIRWTVANRAPRIPRQRYRLGHDVRRLSPGRGGQDLLALCQFPVSVLDADAAGRL